MFICLSVILVHLCSRNYTAKSTRQMKQSANPADETVCQTRQKLIALVCKFDKDLSVCLSVCCLDQISLYNVYLSDETVLQARQMTCSGRPGSRHALADPAVEML